MTFCLQDTLMCFWSNITYRGVSSIVDKRCQEIAGVGAATRKWTQNNNQFYWFPMIACYIKYVHGNMNYSFVLWKDVKRHKFKVWITKSVFDSVFGQGLSEDMMNCIVKVLSKIQK